MAKNIAVLPEKLGEALGKELLIYHSDVVERLNAASETAVKQLVKKTKASAPVRSGAYKRSIAGKLLTKTERGDTYVWYVKEPHYRLTHLLVHGHATKDGGRTKPNPFLQNALDEILPEYEAAVEEAVKNDK